MTCIKFAGSLLHREKINKIHIRYSYLYIRKPYVIEIEYDNPVDFTYFITVPTHDNNFIMTPIYSVEPTSIYKESFQNLDVLMDKIREMINPIPSCTITNNITQINDTVEDYNKLIQYHWLDRMIFESKV